MTNKNNNSIKLCNNSWYFISYKDKIIEYEKEATADKISELIKMEKDDEIEKIALEQIYFAKIKNVLDKYQNLWNDFKIDWDKFKSNVLEIISTVYNLLLKKYWEDTDFILNLTLNTSSDNDINNLYKNTLITLWSFIIKKFKNEEYKYELNILSTHIEYIVYRIIQILSILKLSSVFSSRNQST